MIPEVSLGLYPVYRLWVNLSAIWLGYIPYFYFWDLIYIWSYIHTLHIAPYLAVTIHSATLPAHSQACFCSHFGLKSVGSDMQAYLLFLHIFSGAAFHITAVSADSAACAAEEITGCFFTKQIRAAEIMDQLLELRARLGSFRDTHGLCSGLHKCNSYGFPGSQCFFISYQYYSPL